MATQEPFTLQLDPVQLHAVWAAMISMVEDVHAPQDQMTEEQWMAAEAICKDLTAEMDRLHAEERKRGMTTRTHVTGNELREGIRRWELRRDTAFGQFDDSLSKFPEETKPDPKQVAADFNSAEDNIVALQVAQTRYNVLVEVEVQGRQYPLEYVIKRLGGAGRLESMWRGAVGVRKKDRFSSSSFEETRREGEIRKFRTITVQDCIPLADKAAVAAGALRAALSQGNAVRVELSKLGLDAKLLEL